MDSAIGFIGLGQMGARMAARLVASGARVVAFDVDAVALARLVDLGATPATSAADVASQALVVLCSLPRPDIVEVVMLGPDGIATGSAVEVVIDLSTTGSAKIAEIAAALAERQIDLVDAPVSGGVGGAEAGTLTLMVSGNPAAVARVDPILRLLGDKIFVMGDAPGLGQKMKLVNNMLVAAHALAAFETLVMGAKSGLDPVRMVEVVNASSGRSFITTDKIPQCVLPRTFPPRFATELLLKDVKLGMAEAAAIGCNMPVMARTLELIEQAMAEGDPHADYTALIRYFERRAGVELSGIAEGQSNEQA